MAILQNTGYATPEAAKILGIPAGYYGSPTGEPEEEPVEEPTTEPDTGGPGATLPEGKQTEKTDKFVKGFTLTWEDAQRMGMSKDQYLAMVEDRVLRSGLSDEEIVWLGEHYGLDFAKRVG